MLQLHAASLNSLTQFLCMNCILNIARSMTNTEPSTSSWNQLRQEMIAARALNQPNKPRLSECGVEAILRIELCSDYVRPLQLLVRGSR